MIDFNDACRYQNCLKDLLDTALRYLGNSSFTMITTETHHKSDANAKLNDEVKVHPSPFDDPHITPTRVIQFVMDVIDERSKLSNAIAKAKADADLQIDAACRANKDKMSAAMVIERLCNQKSQEYESTATSYMINEIDGKQTPFVYNMTTVSKIDYDRNVVKGILGRLRREMKEASKNIERFNLDTVVDFEPRWSENDTIEDILGSSN